MASTATDVAVLYFHGSSSTRDHGPSRVDSEAADIKVIRTVRPGYDRSPVERDADLLTVARLAVEEAAQEAEELVAMGWSGGGPYALAAGIVGGPIVRSVCLLGSWAPMNPPHHDLPTGVRLFMTAGRWAPRPVLRGMLAAVGLRNPGHVDDVRRIARPWGFAIGDVTSKVPVAVWHAEGDIEAPIAPWQQRKDLTLFAASGDAHDPSPEVWQEALIWAKASLA